MSAALEELRGVYESYYAAMEEKRRSLKPGQGVFGMGGGLGDAPCNDKFAQELEALLSRGAAAFDSAQAGEAVAYIFAQSQTHREPQAVYWMLLAAHGLVTPLIPLLEPAEAAALAEEYERHNPRRQRLPAQEKMLAALKRRGTGE